MRKLFALVALLVALVPGVASAGTVRVSWVNPTTTTAGGPLTGADALTKFQFYIGTTPLTTLPATPTTEVLAVSPLQTTYTFTAASGDTVYVRMTACNAAGCSAASNQASATVPFPAAAPGTPQTVTITVTIP